MGHSRPAGHPGVGQKPDGGDRTPEEAALFKLGLAALPIWYGHAETVMWMQPELPEGFGERMAELGLAETYETSGWCFVESSVSQDGRENVDMIVWRCGPSSVPKQTTHEEDARIQELDNIIPGMYLLAWVVDASPLALDVGLSTVVDRC